MGRRRMLDDVVPRLRRNMAEKDRPLSTGEIQDLLGLSQSSAYNALIYMEALDMIGHVKSGRKHLYYLKGAYDGDRLAAMLERRVEERRPRRRKLAVQEMEPSRMLEEEPSAPSRGPSPPSDLLPALAIIWTPPPELKVEEPPLAPPEADEAEEGGTPIYIRAKRYSRVELLPKDLRWLTTAETRYLKERYLRELDGYEEVKGFDTFFVDRSMLARGEYGNTYFMCRGAPYTWKKIYEAKVLSRDGIDMGEVRFKLKPIEEEPPKYIKKRGSKYDPILDQFLESGHKLAEVTIEGKKLGSVFGQLKKRIEIRGLKDRVSVGYRGGVLYLKKL